MHHVENRFYVDRVNSIELLLRDLRERFVAVGPAGIVDYYVKATERFGCELHRFIDVISKRDVALEGFRVADLRRNLDSSIAIQIHNDHRRTFTNETTRYLGPK